MHFQTERVKLTNEIRSRSKITSNQLIRVQSSFLDLSVDHSYISVVNDTTDRTSDWIQKFRHFVTRNVAFRRVKKFVKISSPLNQMQSDDETPSTEQDNLESEGNSSQNTNSKPEPVCEQTECKAEYISERDSNHVQMDKTPQSKSTKDCLRGLCSPTVIHVVGRSPARNGGWNNLKNGNKNAKTEADLRECPLIGSQFEEVAQSKEVIRKYHQAIMDEMNSLFKETMEESLHNPETAHDCTKTVLGRLTATSHCTKWKRGYCGANIRTKPNSRELDLSRTTNLEPCPIVESIQSEVPSATREIENCHACVKYQDRQLQELRDDLIHCFRTELAAAKQEILDQLRQMIEPLFLQLET